MFYPFSNGATNRNRQKLQEIYIFSRSFRLQPHKTLYIFSELEMCLESKDSIVAKCPEIYFVKKSQYAIV